MDQGSGEKSQCELYDPVTNFWHKIESIKNEKVGLSVVSMNNRVYAIGGYDRVIVYYKVKSKSTVECYNPETNVLHSVAPMTFKRSFFAACALDGKIFALGGHGNVVLRVYENNYHSFDD